MPAVLWVVGGGGGLVASVLCIVQINIFFFFFFKVVTSNCQLLMRRFSMVSFCAHTKRIWVGAKSGGLALYEMKQHTKCQVT